MLVARRRERAILDEVLMSRSPELVAIYGRRRIGKTFLVREFFGAALALELTGSHASELAAQLGAFAVALGRAMGSAVALAPPRDWPEAFTQLEKYLRELPRKRGTKHVVFFDELPWLATRRSGFLAAFEHFWNGWASAQSWLVVVICGSSASWMLNKVVRQRGGLHNRVTRRMRLDPLTLAEAQEYLEARDVHFGAAQVLELYMALGGVPHYLNQARPG
jgi:AAA+ ATPase superfamily predicted ATPase